MSIIDLLTDEDFKELLAIKEQTIQRLQEFLAVSQRGSQMLMQCLESKNKKIVALQEELASLRKENNDLHQMRTSHSR